VTDRASLLADAICWSWNRTLNLTQFFTDEGVKEAEIIDSVNKHYGRDVAQRTSVYYWIKTVKSERKQI
jgi:hypothetical protein